MNYKKIVLTALISISALSIITFLKNDAQAENLNLKFTDIYGDRKELDSELTSTVPTIYGKARDIKINKNEVILSNDYEFDSELNLKKEEIIKNNKFYKSAKGIVRSNIIPNEEERFYGKLIKDKGIIKIYQSENNNIKEFNISLNEKELKMIKTSKYCYLDLIGKNDSIFYATLKFQNFNDEIINNDLLIEINSELKNYKSLQLNLPKTNIYNYYYINNNNLYLYNGCYLYNIDFKNNKFSKLMDYNSSIGSYSVPFDENYFYALHDGLSPSENKIWLFNLETGDIIDCGDFDIEQVNNHMTVKLKGDKLYKIYKKEKTEQEYANDVEKTTRIIEVYNIKTKKTLYKGELEINKDIPIDLKVA